MFILYMTKWRYWGTSEQLYSTRLNSTSNCGRRWL